MSEKKQVRVLILGAGCSAKCEYPLGIGLTKQLQEFHEDIPANCTHIRLSVSNTVNLMQRIPGIETLDQLAKQIDDDFLAWSAQRGSIIADQAYLDRERLTDQRILDAKIATSAMFVAREKNARKTGLLSYHHLLESLFGGEPWQVAVAESDCRVLSFNYDRLIEIGFLKYFKSFNPQQFGMYARDVLNSGFNDRVNGGYDKVEAVPNHFCFLKLHGSAGWWVKKPDNCGNDERRYWPAMPSDEDDLQKIEQQLNVNEKQKTQSWEPLIAFPHEKQRAVKGQTDFLADRYLEKIEAHAATVLAGATEVRIIGYSFAPIDSRHVVNNLLNRIPARSRIIIQNTDVASVRSRLEAYPTMSDRVQRGCVEFDPTPF